MYFHVNKYNYITSGVIHTVLFTNISFYYNSAWYKQVINTQLLNEIFSSRWNVLCTMYYIYSLIYYWLEYTENNHI